jgi:hypothetical protein
MKEIMNVNTTCDVAGGYYSLYGHIGHIDNVAPWLGLPNETCVGREAPAATKKLTCAHVGMLMTMVAKSMGQRCGPDDDPPKQSELNQINDYCSSEWGGATLVYSSGAFSFNYNPFPTYTPSCLDGVKNGQETDIDCGRGCSTKCGAYQRCDANADCTSNNCVQHHCAPAAGCYDGLKNGTETDVDCGGGKCKGCAIGDDCVLDRDCDPHAASSDAGVFCSSATSTCTARPSTCADGLKTTANGEVDVDCGGQCKKCLDGQMCTMAKPEDCLTGRCTSFAIGQDLVERCGTPSGASGVSPSWLLLAGLALLGLARRE